MILCKYSFIRYELIMVSSNMPELASDSFNKFLKIIYLITYLRKIIRRKLAPHSFNNHIN